jgi:hypothetical protein
MVTIDNNGDIIDCEIRWNYCGAKEGSFCMDCPLTKIDKKKK